MTNRQEQLREGVRDWLRQIMDKHKVSQRQLALRSGISPATINRAMDPDGSFVMSTTIMAKVSEAFGDAPPGAASSAGVKPAGFGESDLVPFEAAPEPIAAKPGVNRGRWIITSKALDLEGFKPGDVVEFDFSVKPGRGDVVVAQVYDHVLGTAETVLRVFQPPFLLTRSSDAGVDQRVLMVDGDKVVIVGTFDMMVRRRVA